MTMFRSPRASALSRRVFLMQSAIASFIGAEGAVAASSSDRVQLASAWPVGQSPRGYLVSEKFDGVRAVWDGQVLRFRSGRVIAAPDWFLATLPALPLDGELWMARGQFDRVSGAVRKNVPDDLEWRAVKYLVFDAWGRSESFAQRVKRLVQAVQAAKQPWLLAVAQTVVEDAAALEARLQEVISQGGEGLVLHRADAPWQAGRTEALFKLKPQADDEARVVGYQAGKGRLQGLTGALLLETPQGQRFALGAGLSDALRRNPPPLGTWVTFSYRDRTPSGLPRFASFVRVRPPE